MSRPWSSRVNQEKMKRHRETILPHSPTAGPPVAPKGRVAAPVPLGEKKRKRAFRDCIKSSSVKLFLDLHFSFLFQSNISFLSLIIPPKTSESQDFLFAHLAFCFSSWRYFADSFVSYFLRRREFSLCGPRATITWTRGRVPRDPGAPHREGRGGLHPHTCRRHTNLSAVVVSLSSFTLTLFLPSPLTPPPPLPLGLCAAQQILNCALDDIEIFVSRLQKAAEAFTQLNHRNKSKKNKKKGPAGLSPFLLLRWCCCCAHNMLLYC